MDLSLVVFPSGILDIGDFSYPFNFQLPPDLPSSCNLKTKNGFGTVCYTISVNLKARPSSPMDLVHFIPIDILGASERDLTSASEDESRVTQGCLLPSGTISLKASAPTTAWVSNSSIPVSYEVKNMSQKMVSKVTVKLVENFSYSGHKHHVIGSRTLVHLVDPGIPPLSGFGSDFGTPCRLALVVIPESSSLLSPSNTLGSLKIEHNIVIEAHTEPVGSNPRLCIQL